MNKMSHLICVIISIIIFNSCSVTRNEQFKLSKELLFAEQRIKNVAYEGCDYQFGLVYFSLIKKRNNIGVYTFSLTSAHRTYYKVFMFDGNNIFFSNIDQESELKNFLAQNSFSKRKQKLMFKRIIKIKKHNEEVYKNQIW